MRAALTCLIVSAFLFSEHPEHPEHPSEHPTKVKEMKLTIDELAIAIESYLQNDISLKGGFFVYD